MTTAVMRRDTLMPRPPGGLGRGLALALMVHGLLVVAIAFSVRWRASEPVGIEAELWSSVPQVAAPPPPPPAPPPQPAPAPAPPPPPAARTEEPDPQIAIEQAKRYAAEQKRREEVEHRRREAELAEQRRKEEAAKLAEQRRKDEAAKLAEQRRKAQEDEKRAERQEQQRAAELERARQKRIERMLAEAGGGDPSSTGRAERSSGPSANYAGRVRARIKPNIVFIDSVSGNPAAEVALRMAPDGTIVSRRIAKSSGSKEWDEAVLRAVDRTQVLPRDENGTVPADIVLVFRPND